MSVFTASRHSNTGNGFKSQELLQSQSPDVRQTYCDVVRRSDDFQPSIRSNDVASKFRAAYEQLTVNPIQRAAMECLEVQMRRIEESIDPTLLNFTIDQSPDDDVVLHHSHPAGVSSLILHEDGLAAFSFIARQGVERDDELTFHESTEADWEGLALHFLVGQGK